MKKLYVHIGAHRTGTTYLQKCLHLNAPELARCGIDALPDLALWEQGHHNVAWAYLEWALRDDARTAQQYRLMFRERVRTSPLQSVFVSSEFFELFDDAALRRFQADLDGFEIAIVYSIRNQPDYFKSYYVESLKHSITDEFEVWLEKRMLEGFGDFYAVTRRWSDGLPKSAVRIVIYDNLLHSQTNIFEFFARDVLSLPVTTSLRLPSQNRINKSIDAQLQWLLREMNRRHGTAESHVTGIGARYLRMRRRLERAYAELSASQKSASSMQLDPLVVRNIEARFEASNALLLREFKSNICNATTGSTLFPEGGPEAAAAGNALEPVGQRELLDLLFAILIDD